MSEERDVPLPGVTIQKELDARDWTQRDLAYVLGTDETAINRLLKGHYRISADMARALASAFGKELRFLPIYRRHTTWRMLGRQARRSRVGPGYRASFQSAT